MIIMILIMLGNSFIKHKFPGQKSWLKQERDDALDAVYLCVILSLFICHHAVSVVLSGQQRGLCQ